MSLESERAEQVCLNAAKDARQELERYLTIMFRAQNETTSTYHVAKIKGLNALIECQRLGWTRDELWNSFEGVGNPHLEMFIQNHIAKYWLNDAEWTKIYQNTEPRDKNAIVIEDIGSDYIWVRVPLLRIDEVSDIFSDIPGKYLSHDLLNQPLKGGWIFPSFAKPLVQESLKNLTQNFWSPDH